MGGRFCCCGCMKPSVAWAVEACREAAAWGGRVGTQGTLEEACQAGLGTRQGHQSQEGADPFLGAFPAAAGAAIHPAWEAWVALGPAAPGVDNSQGAGPACRVEALVLLVEGPAPRAVVAFPEADPASQGPGCRTAEGPGWEIPVGSRPGIA